jgi:hypothetical protein
MDIKTETSITSVTTETSVIRITDVISCNISVISLFCKCLLLLMEAKDVTLPLIIKALESKS